MRNFELSREKFDQLIGFLSKDQALVSQLRKSSREESQRILVVLDESLSEKLVDVLTEELAVNGFDRDYHVNSTGEALESLVDVFGGS